MNESPTTIITVVLAFIAVISALVGAVIWMAKRKPANGNGTVREALERIEAKLKEIDKRVEDDARLTRHDIRQDLRGISAELADLALELGIIKDRMK